MNRFDLVQEMSTMTKPELWMTAELIKRLDKLNGTTLSVVPIKSSELDCTGKQYIKRAYKLLNKRGIVHRLKKELYMVNPDLMIPIEYNLAIRKWNELRIG